MTPEIQLSKRIRVYWLDFYDAMSLLTPRRRWRFISVPKLAGPPEGSVIYSVTPDLARRALMFVVSHPSFDPVEPGQIPPGFDRLSVVWDELEIKEPERR